MPRKKKITVEDSSIKSKEENTNILPEYRTTLKYKNIKQKKMYNAICSNRITFVKGAAGTGKAQPLTSNILTPDGWVKMGDLEIGDYVISRDGNPTKILGIFPQGEKEIFSVVMDDGSKTESCGEHLWHTQTYNERDKRRKSNGSVKTLYDIKKSLIKKDKHGMRLNHYIPLVEPINFNKRDIKIDPYIMGLLIGDGSLKNSVSLTKIDDYIKNKSYEYIKTEPKFNNLKIRQTKNQDTECVTLHITKEDSYSQKEENMFLNDIKSYFFNIKSHEKFIPHEYLYNSTDIRLEILRGLMDSDGWVSKNSCIFGTTSEKLKENVCFLINSLGGTYKITNKIPKYSYKKEIKNGKEFHIISFKIKDINPFNIPRKKDEYDIISNNRNYNPIRRIKEVVSVGIKECQCIMVDNTEHLYVTDDFIVTHNTIIALKAALDILKNEGEPIDKMILLRSMVQSSVSKMGELPGSVEDKTSVYFSAFYENLIKLIGSKNVKDLKNGGFIDERIVNFERGSTYGSYDHNGKPIGRICVIDEAQNLYSSEIKTIISRMGENTRLVFFRRHRPNRYKTKKR